VSSSGDDLVICDKEGFISFISKNKLSWRYNIGFEIKDIKITALGDYFVILDAYNRIYLFSKVFNIEKMGPIWSLNLRSCKIRGIYSAGSVPPFVRILVVNNENISIFTEKGDQAWTYNLKSEEMMSKMSWDGCWLCAIDSDGLIYLFNINEPKPMWILKTNIYNASLDISLDNRYIFIGGNNEKNKGVIYLLTLREGKIIFYKETESSIRNVYISSDGSKMFSLNENGILTIFYKEGENINEKNFDYPKKIKEIYVPPYGSYLLAVNFGGELYLFHLSRPAPLWRFISHVESPLTSISLNGEKIILIENKKINIFTNTPLSEIIPGSRELWTINFSVGIIFIISMILAFMKKQKIIAGDKSELLNASIGFAVGTLIGFFKFKSMINSVMFSGLTSAISCALTSKKKNIPSFILGWYIGSMNAGGLGFLLGLSTWLSGDERDIVQLTVYNAIYGLNVGILYSVLGVIIGMFITLFYKKAV
jgi:WD40 repeat protein